MFDCPVAIHDTMYQQPDMVLNNQLKVRQFVNWLVIRQAKCLRYVNKMTSSCMMTLLWTANNY
jgi:hypothetical protein